MVTADVEVRRRQLSLAAGVLFGVGWLFFIDAIVTFNGATSFCRLRIQFRFLLCLVCAGLGSGMVLAGQAGLPAPSARVS